MKMVGMCHTLRTTWYVLTWSRRSFHYSLFCFTVIFEWLKQHLCHQLYGSRRRRRPCMMHPYTAQPFAARAVWSLEAQYSGRRDLVREIHGKKTSRATWISSLNEESPPLPGPACCAPRRPLRVQFFQPATERNHHPLALCRYSLQEALASTSSELKTHANKDRSRSWIVVACRPWSKVHGCHSAMKLFFFWTWQGFSIML